MASLRADGAGEMRSDDGARPAQSGRAALAALALRVAQRPDDMNVIRRKDGKTVGRVRIDGGATLIIKLWSPRSMKASVKRWLRQSPAMRESRALRRLRRAGVRAPAPLARVNLPASAAPFDEALFLEDFGCCEAGMDHLAGLTARGDEAAIDAFDKEVIEMTRLILDAGVVDADHSLVNVVATADGRLARLDCETARWVGHPRLAPRALARTAARLIGTYVYAVQPDVQRAERFASRLADRLGLSQRARRRVAALVDMMLDTQRRESGVDTKMAWSW